MGNVLAGAHPATQVRPLKFLVFGPSKTGKTTLAATAPKAIMLDTEGGAMSARGSGIDVLDITTWSLFEEAVLELTMGGHGYQSVILDSVTLLQEVAGRHVDLLGYITSSDKDARQAYGAIGAMIRHKLLQLNNLPMNVIFTAQLREREAVDIEAGQYPLVPEVTPAIHKVLVAAPDVIARTAIVQTGTTTNDIEYRVFFGPETRSQVGNRDLKLPPVATGLTVPKLIKLIKENA